MWFNTAYGLQLASAHMVRKLVSCGDKVEMDYLWPINHGHRYYILDECEEKAGTGATDISMKVRVLGENRDQTRSRDSRVCLEDSVYFLHSGLNSW